jgi:hypothetical protein
MKAAKKPLLDPENPSPILARDGFEKELEKAHPGCLSCLGEKGKDTLYQAYTIMGKCTKFLKLPSVSITAFVGTAIWLGLSWTANKHLPPSVVLGFIFEHIIYSLPPKIARPVLLWFQRFWPSFDYGSVRIEGYYIPGHIGDRGDMQTALAIAKESDANTAFIDGVFWRDRVALLGTEQAIIAEMTKSADKFYEDLQNQAKLRLQKLQEHSSPLRDALDKAKEQSDGDLIATLLTSSQNFKDKIEGIDKTSAQDQSSLKRACYAIAQIALGAIPAISLYNATSYDTPEQVYYNFLQFFGVMLLCIPAGGAVKTTVDKISNYMKKLWPTVKNGIEFTKRGTEFLLTALEGTLIMPKPGNVLRNTISGMASGYLMQKSKEMKMLQRDYKTKQRMVKEELTAFEEKLLSTLSKTLDPKQLEEAKQVLTKEDKRHAPGFWTKVAAISLPVTAAVLPLLFRYFAPPQSNGEVDLRREACLLWPAAITGIISQLSDTHVYTDSHWTVKTMDDFFSFLTHPMVTLPNYWHEVQVTYDLESFLPDGNPRLETSIGIRKFAYGLGLGPAVQKPFHDDMQIPNRDTNLLMLPHSNYLVKSMMEN